MSKHITFKVLPKWGLYPVDSKRDGDSPTVDLRSVVFYRDLHRFISRYWKPHLSASEYSILDMIFDRTIGWGKLWEWISLNQFVFGVWSRTIVYSDGTRLGKRTVQRALERLIERGVICCKKDHGEVSRYAINLFWKPPQLEYPREETAFHPEGAADYWQRIASKESAEIVTIIQREPQGFYDCDLKDGTEPGICD